MRKFLRWFGIALAVLAGLAMLALAYVYFASGRVLGRSYDAAVENLPAPSAALLADAPRQARILGCLNCHDVGLKGKLMFDEPGVGSVSAPNLTQVAAEATDQQLAAAIRQGIGRDGRGLFLMPSGLYSRLGDGEVAALIAFVRSQKRDTNAVSPVSWGPLGRAGIVAGKLRPQPDHIDGFRTKWPHELGPRFAPGRRLAATVCAECHMPDLSGGAMEGDIATPNLAVAGGYSFEEFRTLLRTGKGTGGRDLGLMSDVSRKDFKHFTDQEIRALYDYLTARAERVTR